MRIIGGAHRGRKLLSPADHNIRPTSDRMRESIFNILSHTPRGLEGANILDVFAGTGAMGLEALSRGAAHSTFFDKSRKSLQLVQKNISLLELEEKATIRCISAPDFPPSKTPYDVIFLDPPYRLSVINDVFSALKNMGYLADHCRIVFEYSSSNTLILPDYLEIIKNKTYGNSHFTILKKI